MQKLWSYDGLIGYASNFEMNVSKHQIAAIFEKSGGLLLLKKRFINIQ